MKVLVLGGTGVISRAVVDRLLLENHEVSVFNRGSRVLPFRGAVETMIGDRSDRAAFESAMRARRFDAVIDMICFNADDARSSARAFDGCAGHLLIASSVAAYKRPYRSYPVREDAEELWDDPIFPYAFQKAEMERWLFREKPAFKTPVTLFRPSLTFGPGAANVGVLRQNYGIVDRIRRGKPLVMFGDGNGPWSFTFAPDLARGIVGLAGNPKAFGQAFNISSEFPNVWNDLYREFGRAVGVEPKIVHIATDALVAAAPSLCAHLHHEKCYAGLFDNAKLRDAVPGFRAEIALAEGVRELCAWFEAEARTIDPAKDALEDKLCAAAAAFADSVARSY